MKKFFTALSTFLLLFSAVSCSQLVSPNTKKVNATVNITADTFARNSVSGDFLTITVTALSQDGKNYGTSEKFPSGQKTYSLELENIPYNEEIVFKAEAVDSENNNYVSDESKLTITEDTKEISLTLKLKKSEEPANPVPEDNPQPGEDPVPGDDPQPGDNPVQTGLTVSCLLPEAIPAIPLDAFDDYYSELDSITGILMNALNPTSGESLLTVSVTGQNYSKSMSENFHSYFESTVTSYLEKTPPEEMENALKSILNNELPLCFEFEDVPLNTALTITATLSYKEATAANMVTWKTTDTASVSADGKMTKTLSLSSSDKVTAYDWATKRTEALASINFSEAATFYFASEGNEEEDLYTLQKIFETNSSIGEKEKALHLVMKNDTTLPAEPITIKTYQEIYLDLNGNTLTVTAQDGGDNTSTYAFVKDKKENENTLHIYNGTITVAKADTNKSFMFLQNTDGTTEFTGVKFKDFNYRIINQYSSGKVSLNYCEFENCNVTENTGGLITMYDSGTPDYYSGTLDLTGCRFAKCSVTDHALFRIHGTMTAKDLVITDCDYTGYTPMNLAATIFKIQDQSNLTLQGSYINVKAPVKGSTPYPAISFKSTGTFTLLQGDASECEYTDNKLIMENSTVAITNAGSGSDKQGTVVNLDEPYNSDWINKN